MDKIYVGIDPGAKGCVAVLWKDQVIYHPTAKTEFKEVIDDLKLIASNGDPIIVHMEKVGGFTAGKPLPGSSMFKMGHSAGMWEGAVIASGWPLILVRPQEWQRGLTGLGKLRDVKRKRALKSEAVRRFPQVKVTLDNCDALLIADYARRNQL